MVAEGRRNRIVAWALALILLAVGAAGGVAADRLLGEPRPRGGRGPPAPAEHLERLERDLDLSEAQASAIRPILEERGEAMAALFARMDPEAEAIRKRTDARVRALLGPEQQARFDVRVAEGEQRRAEVRSRLERSRRR